jgi:hypothetical protein
VPLGSVSVGRPGRVGPGRVGPGRRVGWCGGRGRGAAARRAGPDRPVRLGSGRRRLRGAVRCGAGDLAGRLPGVACSGGVGRDALGHPVVRAACPPLRAPFAFRLCMETSVSCRWLPSGYGGPSTSGNRSTATGGATVVAPGGPAGPVWPVTPSGTSY